jgi:hypothetical protein
VDRNDRFARTRPQGPSISRHDALETVRRLRKDDRYRRLSPLAKQALPLAVTEWMNGDGVWWVSWRTWARELGCHPDSLRAAVRPASDPLDFLVDHLVKRTPYLRPPTGREDDKKRQGANIFRLDPALLPEGGRAGPHRGEGQATQWEEGDKGGSSGPSTNVLKGTAPKENESEQLRSETRFALSDGIEGKNLNYIETIEALRALVAWLPDADENTFATFAAHFSGVDAWDIQQLLAFMVGRDLRAAQGKAEPFQNYSAYVFEALRQLVDGRDMFR